MAQQPLVKLSDGTSIPQIGFGTYKIDNTYVENCLRVALDAGYRHIDTAAFYDNEIGIGVALGESGLARDDYWVTSKIMQPDQGYDATLMAYDAIAARLDVGALDMVLIHWPAPARNLYLETWEALIALQKDGRVKSIGVSNFNPGHLERIIGETGVVPVVNQIELHPAFQQRGLCAFNASHNIITQSWSPLGRGVVVSDPDLMAIGKKYGKTAVQVVIRWHLDKGLIPLPKSETPERIRANFDVLDFTLDADDMAKIAMMDRADGRIGFDPELMV